MLRTEKAQRRLVENLKAGRPKRGAKTSSWFRKVSKKRKEILKKIKRYSSKMGWACYDGDFPRGREYSEKIHRLSLAIRNCHRGMCCQYCKPDGDCDWCETIDGINMEVVNNYASTCDGCAELTMHVDMEMDPHTQFGYCPKCVKKGINE